MTSPAHRLDGMLAVLTGASRPGQVGEVVARQFAERGATVALIGREEAEVELRAADLREEGFSASGWGCDLTDNVAVSAVAARIDATHPGGVGALVCLAGGYSGGSTVANTEPAIWERMLAANLTTAQLTTRAFLPLVRQARGSILYFASTNAIAGGKSTNMAAYGASKSGVVILMRAVAEEERRNGVRANAIAPTAVRTAANLASMGDSFPYVERETVAEWATFLCSRSSGAVSGQLVQLG